MRTPLDTTPQRALVHLLNSNVDAARAIFFVGPRHRKLVSDSLQLVDANPRSMKSRYVQRHVGRARLFFLSEHRALFAISTRCNCAYQKRRPLPRLRPR